MTLVHHASMLWRRRAPALCGLVCSSLLLLACSNGGGGGNPPLAESTITPSGDTENVGLPQKDGVTIRGHFFAPDKKTAIILAHEWQSDQTEWFEFAQTLVDRGYAVFTFDFRGHGETDGETDAGLLDEDLLAAIDFVRSRGKERIVLVGASMGGTTSLVVAEQEAVLAVVGLSPPAEFEEQNALAAVPSVAQPKLLIATEGDAVSLSFDELLAAAAEPVDSEVYPGTAHGTDILCEPACANEESRAVAAQASDRITRFLEAEAPP
jgi:dienelactone hydrolase